MLEEPPERGEDKTTKTPGWLRSLYNVFMYASFIPGLYYSAGKFGRFTSSRRRMVQGDMATCIGCPRMFPCWYFSNGGTSEKIISLYDMVIYVAQQDQ